jgi:hypothetical protein
MAAFPAAAGLPTEEEAGWEVFLRIVTGASTSEKGSLGIDPA